MDAKILMENFPKKFKKITRKNIRISIILLWVFSFVFITSCILIMTGVIKTEPYKYIPLSTLSISTIMMFTMIIMYLFISADIKEFKSMIIRKRQIHCFNLLLNMLQEGENQIEQAMLIYPKILKHNDLKGIFLGFLVNVLLHSSNVYLYKTGQSLYSDLTKKGLWK